MSHHMNTKSRPCPIYRNSIMHPVKPENPGKSRNFSGKFKNSVLKISSIISFSIKDIAKYIFVVIKMGERFKNIAIFAVH